MDLWRWPFGHQSREIQVQGLQGGAGGGLPDLGGLKRKLSARFRIGGRKLSIFFTVFRGELDSGRPHGRSPANMASPKPVPTCSS